MLVVFEAMAGVDLAEAFSPEGASWISTNASSMQTKLMAALMARPATEGKRVGEEFMSWTGQSPSGNLLSSETRSSEAQVSARVLDNILVARETEAASCYSTASQ